MCSLEMFATLKMCAAAIRWKNLTGLEPQYKITANPSRLPDTMDKAFSLNYPPTSCISSETFSKPGTRSQREKKMYPY